MTFCRLLPILLAEGEGGGGGLSPLIPPLIIIGVIFWFVVIRGGRRDRKKRQDSLDSLKKNDRVVTIGGIIGTIASTSQDGKEVTLKIDDNAKMKVLRSAVQGLLREDVGDGSADISKNAATSGESS